MQNAPPDFLTDGSEPMGAVLRELEVLAPTDLTVLVLGPTGCGKELAARALHERSRRAGPLVPVNCSALAEGILESELFGHVRGAFTGATRERKGAVECAEGGTLFLDEVADLSPRVQSLLLRVIQEREVRRVGSDRLLRVDTRFIAATNRPLDRLAASGHFREDLLFRLQGAVLRMPSLAERSHEFAYLVPRLVARVALALAREAPLLEPGLGPALARFPWPGNVRQLLSALERALLACGGEPLALRHFPPMEASPQAKGSWLEATRQFQRSYLLQALRSHGFRIAETARALGMARPALYGAARRLGVALGAERSRWSGG